MTRPPLDNGGHRLHQTTTDDPGTSELPFQPDQRRLPVAGQPETIRYVIEDQLGAGATGRVYLATDHELGRQVAMKTLAGEQTVPRTEAFLREARLAAALEHPNIPPIYEVAATALGQVWFSMRRIDGESLEAGLDHLRAGEAVPLLADISRRVGVVVQVANALRAAHAKGILHRDIKPANIMLGRFGEVLLVDWGTASSGATPGRSGPVGTPLYMSPQQAAGVEATVADDIYALGATLFELLTLRPPLRVRAAADFWQAKAKGFIDAPTSEERRRVPRHLLAIALRAIATAPDDRYASIQALRDDLERWQAGQPVSACRETIDERLRRWWRRHARAAIIAMVMLTVVTAATLLVVGERLKERATWGLPVLVEDFRDESWRERFEIITGRAEQREGRLVSTSPLAFHLFHPQRLNGPTAIEYEGEMLAGSHPCDLSILWSRDFLRSDEGEVHLDKQTLKIQFGAYDGSYTAVIGPDEEHLTWSVVKPVPERRHRLRLEIIGDRLRFLVDGREVVSYRDPFPLEGGYFTLYGYYPGKSFGRIRVYNLGIPERLPATAIGDHLVSAGDLPAAVEAYRRVLASHRGKDIADEARYRLGLCQLRAGDPEAAFAIWAPLADTSHADEVVVQRHQHFLAETPDAELLPDLERIYLHGNVDRRQQVLRLWARGIRALANEKHRDDIRLRTWLDLRDRHFADQAFTDRVAAEVLQRMGAYEEILARFPGQRRQQVFALISLGRANEAIARFPDQRGSLVSAYHDTGRWREVAVAIPEFSDASNRLFEEGRFGEIDPRSGDAWNPYGGYALIACGQLDAALAIWPDNDRIARVVQLHRGDFASVAAQHPHLAEGHLGQGDGESALAHSDGAEARAWHALTAAARGDQRSAAEHFAAHARFQERAYNRRVGAVAGWMEPFWRETQGEAGAFRAACRYLRDTARWNDRQRTWHRAVFLLGEIDDAAFLAQPLGQWAPAELILLRAVRADQADDRAAARAGYHEWLALPTWARGHTTPMAEDAFVAWRLQALMNEGAEGNAPQR